MNSSSEKLLLIPEATGGEANQSAPQENSLASSQQEALYLNQGLSADELKNKAEQNEHNRNEKFRDEFEGIAILGLKLFCGLVAGLIIVWFWHIIMPTDRHWLTPEQFNKIQSLATGGIIASIAAGHVKRRLGQ